jgi:hypothetical protein
MSWQAPTVSVEVEWHLREAARAIRDGPTPLDPDLLRVTLTGLGELVHEIVERQREVAAPPPALFTDDIVAEAARIWVWRIRQAQAPA